MLHITNESEIWKQTGQKMPFITQAETCVCTLHATSTWSTHPAWMVQVHGFSCAGTILINKEGSLVYPVAALIVVNSPPSEESAKNRKQKFFDKHDNAVVSHVCAVCYLTSVLQLSISLHPDGDIVASGSLGIQPYICVWRSTTLELLAVLDNVHRRGISQVQTATTWLLTELRVFIVCS